MKPETRTSKLDVEVKSQEAFFMQLHNNVVLSSKTNYYSVINLIPLKEKKAIDDVLVLVIRVKINEYIFN